ncbi:MAG: glycosyltransferase family 4 protein [Arcobacter sp.]|nr:glycosyltransferase family 4 protein [Arcobacter sp.]
MGFEKMKIAVVFEGTLENGGGYQQQLSTLIELNKIKKYEIFVIVENIETKKVLDFYGIKSALYKNDVYSKIERKILSSWFTYRFLNKNMQLTRFERLLEKNSVDLVYFLSPSILALELKKHNYIITVWDLCHRDFMEFPEVNFFNEFENRENFYNRALKKAVAILSDSELGKKNIVKRYNIDVNRIFSINFSSSESSKNVKEVDIKLKYEIVGNYVYYPAQFWSHKNHIYIIDAIKNLSQKGINLTAIFSGSDKGNLEYVLNYAKDSGVGNFIKYIGFAPNEEIYSLYKNSLALVMPTYFGPTNIPPLEAFEIGTPVIYSDLEGLKEQVGEAALLCDLKDPNSLAEQLTKILNNNEIREDLIEKGKKRLKELNENNLISILEEIFDNYSLKLKCWR